MSAKNDDNAISTRVVRALFGLVFVAMGAWLIDMAIQGRTPAESLKEGEGVIFVCSGLMFAFSGLYGVLLGVLPGGKVGKTIQAVFCAGCVLFFGLSFVSVGVMRPGDIQGGCSVGGFAIPIISKINFGAIVFILVGLGIASTAVSVYKSVRGEGASRRDKKQETGNKD